MKDFIYLNEETGLIMKIISYADYHAIKTDMENHDHLTNEQFVEKYDVDRKAVIALIDNTKDRMNKKYGLGKLIPKVISPKGESYMCYCGFPYEERVIHYSPDCSVQCAIEALNRPDYVLIKYIFNLETNDTTIEDSA